MFLSFQLEVVVPEGPLVRTPGGDCCKQPKVHLRKTGANVAITSEVAKNVRSMIRSCD